MMVDKSDDYCKSSLFYPELRMKEYIIHDLSQVKIGSVLRYKNGKSKRFVTQIKDRIYTLDDKSRTPLAVFNYTEDEILEKFVEVRYLCIDRKNIETRHIDMIEDLLPEKEDNYTSCGRLLLSNNGDLYQVRFLEMKNNYTEYTGGVYIRKDAEIYKADMDIIDFKTIQENFKIITNAEYKIPATDKYDEEVK